LQLELSTDAVYQSKTARIKIKDRLAGCLSMSLSRNDDPRTWLLPGPRAVPRPPLHARLLYYDLTTSQRALIRAYHEHAPEGALLEASPDTLAETSGISVRHQWNLIHGWTRNGRHNPGFLELRIFEEKRKGRRAPKPRPAAYLFHESACHLREELLKRLEDGVQLDLPGVERPRKTITSATVTDVHRKPLPQSSATVADDSKAITSTTRERERFNNSDPLSLDLDQEGEKQRDLEWAKRFARR
jgi:hypothetical protein